MATLYLLIRNLDTGEASGLIKAEHLCNICVENVKEGQFARLGFFNNFFNENLADITCSMNVGDWDYSDLAIIERDFVERLIGPPDGEWSAKTEVKDAQNLYPDPETEEYLEFLTEAQFETYEELTGLPVQIAKAVKHVGETHRVLEDYDLDYYLV